MLRQDHVYFIYGAKTYAVHMTTGQPFVAHFRVVHGEQKVSYFEVEYDQLPEQVKTWCKEYRERTLADAAHSYRGGEMSRDEQIYCDGCLLLIGTQTHVTVKKPGTKGEAPENYLHYHNRSREDCWGKQVRQLTEQYSGRALLTAWISACFRRFRKRCAGLRSRPMGCAKAVPRR